jgi:hypothetical protein
VSIFIESRYQVTWRSQVEIDLRVKYSKSEPPRVKAKARSSVAILMKLKRDEVATINIVQAQVEEIYFIFNLEYSLPLYQQGYHIGYQQSLNAQHSLKTQVRGEKHNGHTHSASHWTENWILWFAKLEHPVWSIIAIIQILDVPILKPDAPVFTG